MVSRWRIFFHNAILELKVERPSSHFDRFQKLKHTYFLRNFLWIALILFDFCNDGDSFVSKIICQSENTFVDWKWYT